MELSAAELAELQSIFKAECDDHLTALNSLLLDLEKRPADMTVINETFRRMHSVKGAARMVGLKGIESIAHALETMLAQIRDGKRAITPNDLSLLFAGADSIAALTASMGGHAADDERVLQMLAKIGSGHGSAHRIGDPNSADPDSTTSKESEAHSGELKLAAPEMHRPNNGDANVENSTPRSTVSEACPGELKLAAPDTHRSANNGDANVAAPDTQRSANSGDANVAAPDTQRSASKGEANVAAPESAAETSVAAEMVRISADKIDKLIALRGELVRTLALEEEELHRLSTLVEDALADADRLRVAASCGTPVREEIDAATADFRRHREHVRDAVARMSDRNMRRSSRLDELRDSLADLRMLPAGTILQGMHRVVRDVALSQSKEAELTVSGADVPVDKVVLDALKEPLIHLIRNAVAHGIEPPVSRRAVGKPAKGTIRVAVSTGTSSATITIEDDGSGIDFERVRDAAIANGFASAAEASAMTESKLTALLFKPGFSTAGYTDAISGRGVGLDVVADRIAQLRGSYTVESVQGRGTRFTLRVPVSLLTSSVLGVKAGTLEVCVQQTDIREAVLLKPEHVINVDGRITATVRDEAIPVVPLAAIAGGEGQLFFKHEGVVPAIILESDGRAAALAVDELAGVSDVIVKTLPRPLGRLAGVAGCAILGSGVPLCVLDGEHLVRAAHDRGSRGAVVHAQAVVKRSLLIADDSLTTRTLLRNIMLSAGYDVETAVDGVDAWNKVQQRNFDCIMSDIEMPNMNGWDFCQRVKRDGRLADTPIVLITSLSKDEERRRGLELGADAYIVKGLFNETQLLETVERLVA